MSTLKVLSVLGPSKFCSYLNFKTMLFFINTFQDDIPWIIGELRASRESLESRAGVPLAVANSPFK